MRKTSDILAKLGCQIEIKGAKFWLIGLRVRFWEDSPMTPWCAEGNRDGVCAPCDVVNVIGDRSTRRLAQAPFPFLAGLETRV
jgi:hypothetical protein